MISKFIRFIKSPVIHPLITTPAFEEAGIRIQSTQKHALQARPIYWVFQRA